MIDREKLKVALKSLDDYNEQLEAQRKADKALEKKHLLKFSKPSYLDGVKRITKKR